MAEKIDSGTRRLWQLGYKQTLPRSLSWVQNCSLCFCIMSPVTAITGLYSQGLLYGGPVVLVWSWILTGAFTGIVGVSMAELSSAFPVSGGLYYWAFIMGHGPLASWVVGWLNLLGQIASVAGNTFTVVSFFSAGLFLATKEVCAEGYYPGNSMQLYIFGGMLILHALANRQRLSSLAKVARIAGLWMVAGTLVVAVVLLVVAERRQKWRWVLTHYESFTGYDSAAHLIEETKAADTSAGYPMLYAITLSFAIGLVYLLTLTLSIQDIEVYLAPEADLAEVSYSAQIMWNAFSSRYNSGLASLAVMLIPLGCCWFCSLLSMPSASRMVCILYGFSRDQAVPMWMLWQQVDPLTGVPDNAVWGNAIGAFLLGLPLLGGVTAFLATTSIATAGLAIAYGTPILLSLLSSQPIEPGPYHLGRWSRPIGWTAVTWLASITAVFCLPATYPITSENMKYAAIAAGSALFLVGLSWVLSAQRWFSGPKVEADNSDIVKMHYWLTDPPRDLGR